MTASLVGQAGPAQRPAARRRRESSEGRLGPLLSQQPTATISPNPAVHLGGPRLASLVVTNRKGQHPPWQHRSASSSAPTPIKELGMAQRRPRNSGGGSLSPLTSHV